MTGSILLLAFPATPLSVNSLASRQLNNVNNDVPGGEAV